MSRRSERYCHVVVNEGYAKDEVLLNLELVGPDIKPGSLVSISPLRSDSSRASSAAYGSLSKQPVSDHGDGLRPAPTSHTDHDCRFIFVAKDMPKELKARQPDVEVYVVKHIADSFGIRKGTQVLLTPVSIAALP